MSFTSTPEEISDFFACFRFSSSYLTPDGHDEHAPWRLSALDSEDGMFGEDKGHPRGTQRLDVSISGKQSSNQIADKALNDEEKGSKSVSYDKALAGGHVHEVPFSSGSGPNASQPAQRSMAPQNSSWDTDEKRKTRTEKQVLAATLKMRPPWQSNIFCAPCQTTVRGQLAFKRHCNTVEHRRRIHEPTVKLRPCPKCGCKYSRDDRVTKHHKATHAVGVEAVDRWELELAKKLPSVLVTQLLKPCT